MLIKNLTFLFLFFFLLTPLFAQDTLQATGQGFTRTSSQLSKGTLDVQTAFVVLNSDTLFSINNTSGQYPAAYRAQQISERLQSITTNYNKEVDRIYIKPESDFVSIMYNDELAFIITERDALSNNIPLHEFASKQMESLKQNLLTNSSNHFTTKENLFRIGYFILSLIGLYILFRLLRWLFQKLNLQLSKIEGKYINQKNNLLRYFIPKSNANIFVFISNMVRFTIVIIVLIAYLPFMFSFFPWAEKIVATFYTSVAKPIKFLLFGFIDFLPDLVFIIVILIISRYLVRVLKYIAHDIESEKLVIKSFPKDLANTTQKIFSILIYAFALVIVIPHLPGSASPAFQGVTIFLGALVSFGSTSAIANIVAGLVITYMRPYQIGDRVKIQDTVGDVLEKTLLITRIRTLKNEEVTIPNSNIIASHLINYTANTKKHGVILHTKITIGYDVPWQKVEDLLLQAASTIEDIEKEPKSFVLETSLDDNYVTYELNAFTKKAHKMPQIYSEMHKNILEEFNKAGIEILSPQYIAARDGNLTTVPSKIDTNSRSPIEKIVDHLTGKNQKITVVKSSEDTTEKGDLDT